MARKAASLASWREPAAQTLAPVGSSTYLPIDNVGFAKMNIIDRSRAFRSLDRGTMNKFEYTKFDEKLTESEFNLAVINFIDFNSCGNIRNFISVNIHFYNNLYSKVMKHLFMRKIEFKFTNIFSHE